MRTSLGHPRRLRTLSLPAPEPFTGTPCLCSHGRPPEEPQNQLQALAGITQPLKTPGPRPGLGLTGTALLPQKGSGAPSKPQAAATGNGFRGLPQLCFHEICSQQEWPSFYLLEGRECHLEAYVIVLKGPPEGRGPELGWMTRGGFRAGTSRGGDREATPPKVAAGRWVLVAHCGPRPLVGVAGAPTLSLHPPHPFPCFSRLCHPPLPPLASNWRRTL